MDIKVSIKPNDTEKKIQLAFKDAEIDRKDFERLLFQAMQEVTKDLYQGGTKEEFNEHHKDRKSKLKNETALIHTDELIKTDADNKSNDLDTDDKDKVLANKAHQKLSQGQKAYSGACRATFYDGNIFAFAGVKLFVDQYTNYYIYDYKTVKNHFSPAGAHLNTDNKADEKPYSKAEILKKNFNFKIGLNGETKTERDKVTKEFHYNKVEPSAGQMSLMLTNLANNTKLGSNKEVAIFAAALLAESSRHTVAHVSNLLALGNHDNSNKPATGSDQDPERVLSMAAGKTDQSVTESYQGNDTTKKSKYDSDLYDDDSVMKKKSKEVTDIDLKSVTSNKKLRDSMFIEYMMEMEEGKDSQLSDARKLKVKKKMKEFILKELQNLG